MMFDTEPGQAEQAYTNELSQAEPVYNRPAKAKGAKKVFGNILASFRGTQDIGDRMLYGDVPEAKEDYSLAVGTRGRRLTHMGSAATLEANRRTARNTAMWRSTDLNIKFAKNKREEDILPRRMAVLESQIGRNTSMAGASDALRDQRRRPNAGRAPFRALNPGQGTYSQETGQLGTRPDPSAARSARLSGSGGPTGNQLVLIERDKAKKLLDHKKERDKRQYQIDADNAGMSPKLPDGSPNPMYTRDNDLSELEKWDQQQKQMIQRSYQDQLSRMGQHVEQFNYGEPSEGEEPDLGQDEGEDNEGELDAGMADSIDAGDEAAVGDEEQSSDIPIGTIYRNPSTGERIQWNGERWVPAR